MNWIELRALNELYEYGQVKINNTLSNSREIKYLESTLRVIDKTHNRIIALEGYQVHYEKHYASKFRRYENFLSETGLMKPQLRFEEHDIQRLIEIQAWKNEGVLDELRKQIIQSNESMRGVSQMFFKNEKYLEGKPSLVAALKGILEVDSFANEKDQQYIYKLECHNPRAIVLCENLDFLTKPVKPRQHGIELWYAGGKNVAKLAYADRRGLPIYYSADWDYDGIFIIYKLVVEKIPEIRLLTPNGSPRGLVETEHKSVWKNENDELGHLLSPEQRCLLDDLIIHEKWIMEESNDLITMLGSEEPPYTHRIK